MAKKTLGGVHEDIQNKNSEISGAGKTLGEKVSANSFDPDTYFNIDKGLIENIFSQSGGFGENYVHDAETATKYLGTNFDPKTVDPNLVLNTYQTSSEAWDNAWNTFGNSAVGGFVQSWDWDVPEIFDLTTKTEGRDELYGSWLQEWSDETFMQAAKNNPIAEKYTGYSMLANSGYSLGMMGGVMAQSLILGAATSYLGGAGAFGAILNGAAKLSKIQKAMAMGSAFGLQEARQNAIETQSGIFEQLKAQNYTDENATKLATKGASYGFRREALTLMALNSLQFALLTRLPKVGANGKVAYTAEKSLDAGISGAVGAGGEALFSGIQNNFVRGAAKYGLSMVSEGVEEGLQTAFGKAATNKILLKEGIIREPETYWDREMYDSILLGSIMGGGFKFMGEGLGWIANKVSGRKTLDQTIENHMANSADRINKAAKALATVYDKALKTGDMSEYNALRRQINSETVINALEFDHRKGDGSTKTYDSHLGILTEMVEAAKNNETEKLKEKFQLEKPEEIEYLKTHGPELIQHTIALESEIEKQLLGDYKEDFTTAQRLAIKKINIAKLGDLLQIAPARIEEARLADPIFNNFGISAEDKGLHENYLRKIALDFVYTNPETGIVDKSSPEYTKEYLKLDEQERSLVSEGANKTLDITDSQPILNEFATQYLAGKELKSSKEDYNKARDPKEIARYKADTLSQKERRLRTSEEVNSYIEANKDNLTEGKLDNLLQKKNTLAKMEALGINVEHTPSEPSKKKEVKPEVNDYLESLKADLTSAEGEFGNTKLANEIRGKIKAEEDKQAAEQPTAKMEDLLTKSPAEQAQEAILKAKEQAVQQYPVNNIKAKKADIKIRKQEELNKSFNKKQLEFFKDGWSYAVAARQDYFNFDGEYAQQKYSEFQEINAKYDAELLELEQTQVTPVPSYLTDESGNVGEDLGEELNLDPQSIEEKMWEERGQKFKDAAQDIYNHLKATGKDLTFSNYVNTLLESGNISVNVLEQGYDYVTKAWLDNGYPIKDVEDYNEINDVYNKLLAKTNGSRNMNEALLGVLNNIEDGRNIEETHIEATEKVIKSTLKPISIDENNQPIYPDLKDTGVTTPELASATLSLPYDSKTVKTVDGNFKVVRVTKKDAEINKGISIDNTISLNPNLLLPGTTLIVKPVIDITQLKVSEWSYNPVTNTWDSKLVNFTTPKFLSSGELNQNWVDKVPMVAYTTVDGVETGAFYIHDTDWYNSNNVSDFKTTEGKARQNEVITEARKNVSNFRRAVADTMKDGLSIEITEKTSGIIEFQKAVEEGKLISFPTVEDAFKGNPEGVLIVRYDGTQTLFNEQPLSTKYPDIDIDFTNIDLAKVKGSPILLVQTAIKNEYKAFSPLRRAYSDIPNHIGTIENLLDSIIKKDRPRLKEYEGLLGYDPSNASHLFRQILPMYLNTTHPSIDFRTKYTNEEVQALSLDAEKSRNKSSKELFDKPVTFINDGYLYFGTWGNSLGRVYLNVTGKQVPSNNQQELDSLISFLNIKDRKVIDGRIVDNTPQYGNFQKEVLRDTKIEKGTNYVVMNTDGTLTSNGHANKNLGKFLNTNIKTYNTGTETEPIMRAYTQATMNFIPTGSKSFESDSKVTKKELSNLPTETVSKVLRDVEKGSPEKAASSKVLVDRATLGLELEEGTEFGDFLNYLLNSEGKVSSISVVEC